MIFPCRILIVTLTLLASPYAGANFPFPGIPKPNPLKDSFSQTIPSLSPEENKQVLSGKNFFRIAWPAAPSMHSDIDGLGPTFNALSCVSCHDGNGRGAGYRNFSEHLLFPTEVSILFRLFSSKAYGDQLNPLAISGIPAEGQMEVKIEFLRGKYPDGTSFEIRKPHFHAKNLRFGEFEKEVSVSPRMAPQLVGMAMIDAIDEKEILAKADPQDEDKDGISGKARWLFEGGKRLLGRFGWKAEQYSLKKQNAAAFLGDLGLTTSHFPKENCPPVQKDCEKAPTGGSPELSDAIVDDVTYFLAALKVPAQRPFPAKGERLFSQVRCDQCHTPTYANVKNPFFPSESPQTIAPYSDFLLHDMGEALADLAVDSTQPKSEFAREWRTPPLWGIGLLPAVNGHQNLLHDGRARNIEEAILWHGGEAERSKQAFMNLSKEDRKLLLQFVESL